MDFYQMCTDTSLDVRKVLISEFRNLHFQSVWESEVTDANICHAKYLRDVNKTKEVDNFTRTLLCASEY